MVDVNAEARLAHARWFLGHKRRWSLCLTTFAATALTLYGVFSAYGRFAAQANLRASRADIERLAPPTIQESQNAAVVWEKAMRATANLEGTLGGKQFGSSLKIAGTRVGISTLQLGKAEWQSAETYAADGAVRIWVTLNEEALRIAAQAAAMENCVWDPAPANPWIDMAHSADMRGIAQLCAARARVAAFDGDWVLVEQNLRAIARGAAHTRSARREMRWLLAWAMDCICVDALEDCLAIARVPPRLETVRHLRAFALDGHDAQKHLAETCETAKHLLLLEIDLAGAREEGSYANQPALLDISPAAYSLTRSLAERLSDKLIVSVRELEATDHYRSVVFNWDAAEWVPQNIFPLSLRIGSSYLKLRATWRVAVSGLAVLEYRATHQGTWPKTLAETGLEPALLKDPCARPDSDLRCRVAEDGSAFWVWSVGEEGKDLSTSSDDDNTWRWKSIVFRVSAPPGSTAQDGDAGKAGTR